MANPSIYSTPSTAASAASKPPSSKSSFTRARQRLYGQRQQATLRLGLTSNLQFVQKRKQ